MPYERETSCLELSREQEMGIEAGQKAVVNVTAAQAIFVLGIVAIC